jgi:hypothetical protein
MIFSPTGRPRQGDSGEEAERNGGASRRNEGGRARLPLETKKTGPVRSAVSNADPSAPDEAELHAMVSQAWPEEETPLVSADDGRGRKPDRHREFGESATKSPSA